MSVRAYSQTIPSRVSCSFLTRMRMGSRMNFCVTSNTSAGIVAERRITLKRKELVTVKLAVLTEKSVKASSVGQWIWLCKVCIETPSDFPFSSSDIPEFCLTCNEKRRRFDPWILLKAFRRPRPGQRFWCHLMVDGKGELQPLGATSQTHHQHIE